MAILVAALLAVTTALLAFLFLRERRRGNVLAAKYGPIIGVEEAVRRSREVVLKLEADAERLAVEQRRQRETFGQEYASAKVVYDRLRAEIAILEEHIEDLSIGLYQPHYDFDSSEKYRQELDRIRAQQKELVRLKQAATAGVEWSVGGSRREGERMQNQYLKLMLRAFNGECDAAVAKVAWNNVTTMEQRIRKGFEAINALGGVMQMKITVAYLDIRLAELWLEHEYEEKKRAEVEEQRRIKEQMREEERALREAERAKREAEEEESRNEKALERARAELALAQGAALARLQERIGHLDAALQRARELKERATTMAQLTRSGHVYVISNLGSFGENVFKIGMTRRLEPLDRIKELGDASVPFDFDVHAMIYCEDAPSLEGALHAAFADRCINLVNPRKEFFAVSIDEIEEAARARGVTAELTKLAEARDYRETLAKRALKDQPIMVMVKPEFPAAL
jgi:hypothetical protein